MLEEDNCNWKILGKILVAKVKELSDRRGLFDISRYSRFLSLKNIFDSTLPLKLLKETLRQRRLTNLEIDNGRGPCSLLLFNQRATNELCRNSPICPVSWLFASIKYCKDGMSYNQDGIVPFSKFLDNLRLTNLEGI